MFRGISQVENREGSWKSDRWYDIAGRRDCEICFACQCSYERLSLADESPEVNDRNTQENDEGGPERLFEWCSKNSKLVDFKTQGSSRINSEPDSLDHGHRRCHPITRFQVRFPCQMVQPQFTTTPRTNQDGKRLIDRIGT